MTDAEIKAELLAVGAVDIDMVLLGNITVPTAGPGAGKTAFFFNWNGHRVRLSVDVGSPLRVVDDNGDVVILKDGKELVRGQIEEELIHCPEQAYITISERCVFDCKYCPVPKLSGDIKSLDKIVGMVDETSKSGKLQAISITSGVADTPENEVDRAVEAIRALVKYDVPIGVSVYPTADSTRLLKEAGAVEIKYNVETMDREIFDRVCPGMDLDFIKDSLKEAVSIFGRNYVFSNFIVGLGETDETVEAGLEELASIDVVPIVRAAGMHPLREGEIDIQRPTAPRLLKLTKILRRILDKHGLRADMSQTMCLPCTGCDINPHLDM
ncbi:MAG: radical SAM protein [Methanosarcinales archaeon]|nr:radical SAM protein [Methanosarcinales archaeon]